MTKTVYLVNGAEAYFRGKFAVAAINLNIPHDYIDLTECVFFVDGKETYLYRNNQKIEPSEGYFFIRKKSQDSYYCYLLAEFLAQHQAPFSDPCNRLHTEPDIKFSQLLRLTKQGIPFPESYICRPYSFDLHRDMITNRLGFPLVVKRAGARGEAVWLVRTEEELNAKLKEEPFEVHILQQFIANEGDIRVIVFEDKIIGAMTRSSADGFANTSYDAVLEHTQLSDQERQLALLASRKAGLDFAGVDIVKTDSGLKVWEINKTPQLDRFIPATGIPALEQILEYIKDKYL
ncbi:ATP-grasp domain-containing protein [Porticoccus sp. GXU_MW_L64]